MNIQLQKLFERYEISAKDRYEFLQIFRLLPAYKQVRVIENFDQIYNSFTQLQQSLAYEQEILLGKTLDKIEEKVQRLKQKNLQDETKGILLEFKNSL